jgi:hypothetical protein
VTRFHGPGLRVVPYRWTIAAGAMTFILATATGVFAQSSSLTRMQTSPTPASGEIVEPLPRVDVTGFLGWLGQRVSADDDGIYTYRAWDNRLLLAGSVGYYWTTHLKAEAEIGGTNTSNFTTNRFVDVPGLTYSNYVWIDHHTRGALIAGRGLYQFGENQWVHPFGGVGVVFDRTRDRIFTPRQTTLVPGPPAPSRTVVLAEESTETRTSHHARPQMILGVKAYANERAFLRTDFVWTFDTDQGRRVQWRVGAGVDF